MLLLLVLWNTIIVPAQEVVLRGSVHNYAILPVNRNSNYTYIWSVSGGTSSVFGNNSNGVSIVWDGPPGVYTITVYPSDKFTGCAGNSRKFRVKIIDFFIRWQGVSTTICSAGKNEQRNFSLVVECSKTSLSWNFEYQVDNNPPVQVILAGETTRKISISKFNGSNTDPETHTIRIIRITSPEGHQFVFDGTEPEATGHSYTVTVNPLPVVNLGSDTSICSPDQLLLDAGNSGLWYEWSTGNRDQKIWASEGDGLIWVKVSNIHHCSISDSIKILPCSPTKDLLIPNVFTPNGDGINDVWEIDGKQHFPAMTVKLFDRWGRLIFDGKPGYPKPWNGQRNGKLLPMDAYYYIIDLCNGTEPLRGSVTLVP
jgi:gliding motility-associated-like protein